MTAELQRGVCSAQLSVQTARHLYYSRFTLSSDKLVNKLFFPFIFLKNHCTTFEKPLLSVTFSST